MGRHKIFKNLGNKINVIKNFFATTTDYESRGQEFESSRAHHMHLNQKCLPFITILVIL